LSNTPVASHQNLSGNIPSLDGIRAVSFILVFAAHSRLEWIVPGGLGVTIFFFLSGYLITTLLRHEFDTAGRISLKHFWLRRALRILPPFYIVLLLAIALAVILQPAGTVSARACLWQALHLGNYWTIQYANDYIAPGTNVYWSLAVEEHFYLLFPWLYVGMRWARQDGRRQALLLWGLCALILLWRIVLVLLLDSSEDRTHVASDTRVDSILFGCALAVWNNPALGETAASERVCKRIVLPLSACAMLFCLLYRDAVFRETVRYTLQGIALTGVFYCAVRFPTWWPFRFLNRRPVMFLGTLSYSMYLIHNVVLQSLTHHIPSIGPILTPVIAFGMTLVLAWVSYKLVELPCARLRRKLTNVQFLRSRPSFA
jgi:peptidoglycan/LPS O-acetylase OafA/YrhL